MSELEYIRSLFAKKIKRKDTLIVPNVTYSEMKGSLNNEEWVYDVGYEFREALDIKYEQRKKNKKPYMVWTQGARIYFKEGDLISSKTGDVYLQILYANSMGWDSQKDCMYEGSVVYDEYVFANNEYVKKQQVTCTQMEFLELLIRGSY